MKYNIILIIKSSLKTFIDIINNEYIYRKYFEEFMNERNNNCDKQNNGNNDTFKVKEDYYLVKEINHNFNKV